MMSDVGKRALKKMWANWNFAKITNDNHWEIFEGKLRGGIRRKYPF
jgi:hypothetical protein